MKQYNIIGDIAGEFDCLMRLVDKLPEGEIILLGDLNDRGPKSKEVIQWAIDNNIRCTQSNHGHMFVDYIEGTNKYDRGVFVMNGGGATLRSYATDDGEVSIDNIPKEHIEYLKNLPLYIDENGLFLSHAAKNPTLSMEQCSQMDCYWDDKFFDDSLIWNRGKPREMPGKLQVMGHNSHWGLTYFGDQKNPWAMCIDTSRKRVLTALCYPSLEIIQEPFEVKQ